MPKPLITLNDPATLINDFNSYLDGNNVLFVVLGGTPQHEDLANSAAAAAQNFELAIYVPQPAALYATLLGFPVDDCALVADYDATNLFAVAIAPDKTICYVMITYDVPSIALAYMAAETH